MLKDIVAMFLTPLYVFSFPRHAELKEEAMSFLLDESLYENYSPEAHIKLSHPNLHKSDALREHTVFIDKCLNFVMEEMGYSQPQSITSLWATRQTTGQFHHPHKHGNTFLAGTYYMNGTTGSCGTTFMNPDNLTQISPNRNMNKPLRLNPTYTSEFVEGDFVVFPAWTLHNTNPNMTDEERVVLGVNSMPIGKTSNEPYDRFFYQHADAVNMDFSEEELNRYMRRS
jgi:uncharacterized protein (TIGR02466 family)